KAKSKEHNVRFVSVPGGGVSKAVYFPIVPTRIGDVMLSAVAQSAKAGDAVEQILRVESEGYRVERNVPLVIDLTGKDAGNSSDRFKKQVKMHFPVDAVEGSRRARVDIIGIATILL
ncbi:unnamed protein product, partial [Gongylonema pulchrum]|uniref:Efflux RND transporter permease subunit n=1 Tax=Gongylonema pulchrum TaxID=637853 RepID=A0A183DHX5_9BILA